VTGYDRSAHDSQRGAVGMTEVETEMVWVGDLAKAEALLAAVEGAESAEIELQIGCDEGEAGIRILVTGDDLREVRAIVDDLLARLSAAEAEYDSRSDA